MKVNLRSARVDQTCRFYREGSVLAGTAKTGGHEFVTSIEIDSDAPEEKVRDLIRMAEQTCYTLQSLTNPVPRKTEAKLNGAALSLD